MPLAVSDDSLPEPDWILNLAHWQLEVHRDPAGDRYGTRTVLGLSEEVSPLFAPEASIRIAKLFPQREP